MIDVLSCREAFTETLLKMARENPNIIALSSDARGSTALTQYTQELPKQFVEVGIAEQNEIGIAAGLAAVGKHPYVCAPAAFLSARCLEQIKIDVAYSHQNVKIFAVSGGVSYGALGSSHHSLHDIAVMRALPGMTVILPCDASQTVAMLYAIEKLETPVYIRVGKVALPSVYSKDAPFAVGKANMLRDGSDVTIIACGEVVSHSLEAAAMLSKRGIKARILDMHTLKPLDEEAIIKAARETGHIVTVEEHSINGGLGSAVAHVVATNYPVPMATLAIPDENTIAGKSLEVFHHYGIDAEGVFTGTLKLLKKEGR